MEGQEYTMERKCHRCGTPVVKTWLVLVGYGDGEVPDVDPPAMQTPPVEFCSVPCLLQFGVTSMATAFRALHELGEKHAQEALFYKSFAPQGDEADPDQGGDDQSG